MPNDILSQVNQPRANVSARLETGDFDASVFQFPEDTRVVNKTPEARRVRSVKSTVRPMMPDEAGREFAIKLATANARQNATPKQPEQQPRLPAEVVSEYISYADGVTARVGYYRDKETA